MREIALHILDIMQNSTAAKADMIRVSLIASQGLDKPMEDLATVTASVDSATEDLATGKPTKDKATVDPTTGKPTIGLATGKASDMLVVTIEDNGWGMDKELLASVTDPFSTTRKTRRVGLGIPLMKASCGRSGGSFEIVSQKGVGTTITAVYDINNIDRPVLGDLAGVITDMAASWAKVDIRLELKCGPKQFEFSSCEAARMLGEVPLSEFLVVKWLKEYISEGINEILGGVLDEIIS